MTAGQFKVMILRDIDLLLTKSWMKSFVDSAQVWWLRKEPAHTPLLQRREVKCEDVDQGLVIQ